MKTTAGLRTEGTIAIVGAGPAGLTLARILNRDGFNVKVYERDASSTARSQGGSLDLRPDSGQQAITAAGLMEEFTRHSRSEASAFRLIDSQGVEDPEAGQETHEDAGPEIDRGDLRQLLIDALPVGTIAWGHTLKTVTKADGDRWTLSFEHQETVTADLVVGADGIGSKVRKQLTSEQPRYTGITMLAGNIRKDLWRGSKISDMLGEGSVMFAGEEKTIFVQRFNRDLILLYYSMKVQESWPASSSFELTDKPAVLTSIKEAFRDWSPTLLDMLTEVEDNFVRWPVSVMPPDCGWQTQPGLTMIGDAAHVMPPFTGKGVNLALYDALQLAQALTTNPAAEVNQTIAEFEKTMQDRTRKEIGECLGVGEHFYGLHMDFSEITSA